MIANDSRPILCYMHTEVRLLHNATQEQFSRAVTSSTLRAMLDFGVCDPLFRGLFSLSRVPNATILSSNVLQRRCKSYLQSPENGRGTSDETVQTSQSARGEGRLRSGSMRSANKVSGVCIYAAVEVLIKRMAITSRPLLTHRKKYSFQE